MEDPQVTFERSQEQAKVTVEQAEPQINVQRAGSSGEQQGQPAEGSKASS